MTFGSDYEKKNVSNMFNYLLININYTAIQTQKPKRHWNLIISVGVIEHF